MLKNASDKLQALYQKTKEFWLSGALQQRLRGVKTRALWVFVAGGVGFGLTLYFRTQVIHWLLAPAHGRLSPTGQPIFTGPTEMLTLTISLVGVGGLVFAIPVLVYHVARFFSPWMNKQQRRFAAIFLPAMGLCFLAGSAFAYFVLLPTGLGYLLQFGTDVAVPMVRISEYMELALALVFWLGVAFELPLAMFLLAKLRLVEYQRFKRLRRYADLAAVIFGAIITPGADPFSWSFVAVPIILLYEVGLGLAWLVRPKLKLVP